MCFLVAKITFEGGETEFYSILYPWDTTFAATGAADHGGLAGLDGDDHPQYIKDSEFTQDSGVLVGTGSGTFQEETGDTLHASLGLTNVILDWTLIATDTNAAAKNGYLINASSGDITLTLPASPAEGDIIGVCDAYSKATTNTITIARNTKNIAGAAEDLVVDVDRIGFVLVYVDATRGWACW
jgi:hypothetical protein